MSFHETPPEGHLRSFQSSATFSIPQFTGEENVMSFKFGFTDQLIVYSLEMMTPSWKQNETNISRMSFYCVSIIKTSQDEARTSAKEHELQITCKVNSKPKR